ncbi:uncharacterized protein [Panulirus ornatus]|uniref:uncharacterized protein n=1 Tax=Panulirus ornatus TaxID=150431 RepID=UPI003A86CC01
MAERRNQYVDREQYLRQAAEDADNMLRQLQDFTLDAGPRRLGRSHGDMGSGNRIRTTSPQNTDEMDEEEKNSGRIEDEEEEELQCSENFLRHETFASEALVGQMQNIAVFDWEEDVYDPFEKAVARSREASRKPMNDPSEIPVARSGEASSTPMNDPSEIPVARSGEASSTPMNDPSEIPVARSGGASSKPMNDPSEISVARSGGASSTPMNDPSEISVARSGGASSTPMNDPSEMTVVRSREANSKPMNDLSEISVARSGGASSTPMNDPSEMTVVRSREANSKPMNDLSEISVARSGEASSTPMNDPSEISVARSGGASSTPMNDPSEMTVVRSREANSKPMNDLSEISVARSGGASSTPMNDPCEIPVARSGGASSTPMNDPSEIPVARSGEASSTPMNDPSEISVARSGGASSTPMNDPSEISVARSGGASSKPMNDPSEITVVRSREASSTPMNDLSEISVARSGGASITTMNDPCEIPVARSGEASSTPMNDPSEITVVRSREASSTPMKAGSTEVSSKPMTDPFEMSVARRVEASHKHNSLMEHSLTYRGHGFDQSDAYRLEGYIQQYGSRQALEPWKESVDNIPSNLNERQKYTWRRQDENYIRFSRRGHDGGAWQHPQRHRYNRNETYSPRDISHSQEKSNRYGARDLATFQGHPKKRDNRSSFISPRREQNRIIFQQPHRQSHISYEEHSPQGVKSMQYNGIKPCLLAEALAECPDFKASLLQLLEWKEMQPSAVRQVAIANEDVFHVNGEMVKLHPKISICQAHSGPQGCFNPSQCNELHICNLYVTSYCQESNCVFGHRWYTNHNKTVLKHFCLEGLPAQSLRYLMTRSMKGNGFTGQLNVCYDYNRRGCSKAYCSDLHVCQSVFQLIKCAIPRCNLNHNLLTPDCCERIRGCGFSTNETQRDVTKTLLAAFPSLDNGGPAKQVGMLTTQAASNSSQDWKTTIILDQQQDAGGRDNRWNTNPSRSGSVSRGNVKSDECARRGKMDLKHSSSSQATSAAKNGKYRTVRSHYLYGDAEIDEICFYSVESTCNSENNGCQRLHATRHFHWQISEQGKSWLNLRPHQVNQLERAFCNPAEDGVVIPRLDPAKLHSSIQPLVTLLGHDTWHANFGAMVLRNPDFSKILYLRRLCTEFIAGQKIAASIYHWFFMDRNKKWVEYGKVDTAGEAKLVSPVTSDDIEKHFLKSQETPLTFKNASYTYVLNFHTMTQTNQSTNVKREVRRRPKPHFIDGNHRSGQRASLNRTYDQDSKSSESFFHGHIRTYRGQNLGQSNTHRSEGYVQQVRLDPSQESLTERFNDSASNLNKSWDDTCRTHNRSRTHSTGRGYDTRTRQQAWRYWDNRYETYSPTGDIRDSQEKTNRWCDMNLPAFPAHPYGTYHGNDHSNFSMSGENRGSRRQPHRFSDIRVDTHSLRDGRGLQPYYIKPWLLVEALAECPDFKATLLQLFEWENMWPSAVQEAVVANGDVLRLNGEVVELRPKISICQAHVGNQGCQDPTVCKELHICHMYVRGVCHTGDCTLGHRWYTDHNRIRLGNFYLERLPPQSLKYLVRGLMKAPEPIGKLDVCYDYNGKGCSKSECGSLHVCRGISSGLTRCSRPKCQLNHNLLTAGCRELLMAHGLSTNETPQDVAISVLAAYPSLGSGGPANQAEATPTLSQDPKISEQPAPSETLAPQDERSQARRKVPRPPLPQAPSTAGQQQDAKVVNTNSGDDNGVISWLAPESTFDTSDVKVFKRGSLGMNSKHLSDDSKITNPLERKKKHPSTGRTRSNIKSRESSKMNHKHLASKKAASVSKNENYGTVWSHYLSGDTKINEICFYSVESLCKYEESGCQRLHAVEHFHWQVSEQGNSWLNLPPRQVNQLERAFCNPAEDGVVIPRLDPAKLHSSIQPLVTLLGRDTWHANFGAMVLRNPDFSKILYLRRLCTEFVAGQRTAASIYHWFFMDRNKKWVEYGQVDTAGEAKLVSPVTSDDIEKHFLKSQNIPLTFKNASYTYVLDFRTMTQTNQSTHVEREVRRRPETHLKDDGLKSGPEGFH